MNLLIAGLAIFTIAHLCLGIFGSTVSALRRDQKEGLLKGAITLLSLIGIALIVAGWRGSTTTQIYALGYNYRLAGLFFIMSALYLFVLSSRPGFIKRIVRHPQLSGVILWSIGHLLLNGDSHSIALFSALGIWAAVEIPIINRREGAWIKPASPGLLSEITTLIIACAVLGGIVWAHPWIAGVPIAGYLF